MDFFTCENSHLLTLKMANMEATENCTQCMANIHRMCLDIRVT